MRMSYSVPMVAGTVTEKPDPPVTDAVLTSVKPVSGQAAMVTVPLRVGASLAWAMLGLSTAAPRTTDPATTRVKVLTDIVAPLLLPLVEAAMGWDSSIRGLRSSG